MSVDILLVSFFYPPYPGVGSRRWGFLSRFFADNGYRVVVVTSPLRGREGSMPARHENIAVHTVPAPLRWTPRIPRLPFIEEWLAWQRPFRISLDRLICKEQPRLLIFTGGPFFSFTLAPDLGKRFSVPYWLDFRDAWGLGSHASLRFSAPLIRHLERHAIGHARMVTDVTPEMTALRRAAFSDLPVERFQVLENGFDGSPGAQVPVSFRDKVLRLGIWGKFSPYQSGHADILMAAVKELATVAPVEIHHFGVAAEETALALAAARLALADTVVFHGYHEYEAGMNAMAGMDAMLVNHRSPLMVGTKVYDAIRMNRPILAFCRPDDALARMLRPFPHAYSAATAAELTAALHDIIRLRPDCLAPCLDPEPFSRRRQGEKFLPLLASMLGRR